MYFTAFNKPVKRGILYSATLKKSLKIYLTNEAKITDTLPLTRTIISLNKQIIIKLKARQIIHKEKSKGAYGVTRFSLILYRFYAQTKTQPVHENSLLIKKQLCCLCKVMYIKLIILICSFLIITNVLF